MPEYRLNINGRDYQTEVDPSTPLLWVLRDSLGLTGTKYGCGKGLCGACTVMANGVAMRSCQLPVEGAENLKIQTIEGVSENGEHPVQQAWMAENVSQCGYCQSGQVMSTIAMLDANPNPTEGFINDSLRGNLCRCGTYPRIRKAIARCINSKEEVR